MAARAALEKHAEGVVVMDLRSLSSVTDFFVICTADSAPQMTAIKDYIEAILSRRGAAVWHTEGTPSTTKASGRLSHELGWVLLDCGEIVVHLFGQQARTFYRLEDLWADAPRVPVGLGERSTAVEQRPTTSS